MAQAAVERPTGMELLVIQRDEPFDHAAPFAQVFVQTRRQWQHSIFLGHRADMDAAREKFVAFLGLGCVCVIGVKHAGKRGLQQHVGALNVVPVSGDVKGTGQHSAGPENEMFANAVVVLVKRCAIAMLGQAAQALFIARALRAADIDRMGVDDEKGGWPSPANWRKASDSL